MAVRQLGILKSLERLTDLYEAMWTKGLTQEQKQETEQLKAQLLKKSQELTARGNLCSNPTCNNEGKLMCGRCKQVKYCQAACQRAHWA